MIRKQIYLEEGMAEYVKKIADARNTSQAEIIRLALKSYLNNYDNIKEENDPLLELIGIADVEIEDGAENHDKYLYGGKLDG